MSNDGVVAVERALTILDCFKPGKEKLTLAQLSSELPLHKTTIYRMLNSLVRFDYVVRHEDGRYSLGPRILFLGRVYAGSFEISEAIMPILEKLSSMTGESAAYYVEHGAEGARLCLFRHQPHEGLHTRVLAGSIMPPDDSSTGRVFKKWAQLLPIEDEPLPYSSQGIRDPYTSSWSVPIIGDGDRFAGALTLAGPTDRLKNADHALCAHALMKCATELAVRLGASREMRESMYGMPSK